MIKPEHNIDSKKFKVYIDKLQRFIKQLELNLREEKRKSARLELELFNLKRRMGQQGDQ
jgi:predicted RNase H-like nuclease (RuvC/YqgF family)